MRNARDDPGRNRGDSSELLVRAIVRDDHVEIQEVLDRFLRGQEQKGGFTKVHGITVQGIDDAHGRVGTAVELHVAYLDDCHGDASATLMEALDDMGKEVIATARLPLGPAPVRRPAPGTPQAPWPPPGYRVRK